MLEKVIKKAKVLNESNPCKFEAVCAPHTHTSDEVFMGDIGEWEGESLTDTLAAIVVMIEGKADVADVQESLAGKQDKIDFSGRDAEETTVTKDDPLNIAWAMDNAPFRVFYIKCAEHGYLHELVTNCIFSNDVELSYDNVRALIVFNAGYDQYFGFISPELDL